MAGFQVGMKAANWPQCDSFLADEPKCGCALPLCWLVISLQSRIRLKAAAIVVFACAVFCVSTYRLLVKPKNKAWGADYGPRMCRLWQASFRGQ